MPLQYNVQDVDATMEFIELKQLNEKYVAKFDEELPCKSCVLLISMKHKRLYMEDFHFHWFS